MESAKSAVKSILSKAGHHDTTVDENVVPGVTEETIKPTRHENITQAVDREVHQHHYHTTVQPLQHQEILPEKHVHNEVPVEEREFYHGNAEETKQRLATEAAKFKDVSTTAPTQMSESSMPVATGEHVHHHVHENVQPVIHKETVVPEVVHTTVPIHEKHTAPSEHHGMSVLPTKSLDEFQQQGGSIAGGTQTHHERYEGDPRPYNASLQQEREPVDLEPKKHDGIHDLESTGHSRPGTSNTASDTVGGTHGAQTGELAGAGSVPSKTSDNIDTSGTSNGRSEAIGGTSGAQTDLLAGVDARGGNAVNASMAGESGHVGGSSGAQTGALAGAASVPSNTTGNTTNPGMGSEKHADVGDATGAQTGALAGAEAAGAALAGERTAGDSSGAQTGALAGADSEPSRTTGNIDNPGMGSERDAGVGGASGAQTGALVGAGAVGAGLAGEKVVEDSSKAQTGALAGTDSVASNTTGNIDKPGMGSEKNAGVGDAHGAQTGTLAGAGEASTFGGEGAFHTDPVGTIPSNMESSAASDVEHFRDDPISAETTGAEVDSNSRTRESTGMESGVAGVGAGAAAVDLAQDNPSADQAGDLRRNDESMTTTDARTGLTGTALGGRTDDNATDFSDILDTSDNTASKMSDSNNTTDQSKTQDDTQQAGEQGRDPNTEGEDTLAGDHPKMTGSGAPGSHSAVFGLTPDGSKDDNTKSGSTPVKPAHSKVTSNTESTGVDTGSRAGGEGVADQMDDPKVNEKGHEQGGSQSFLGGLMGKLSGGGSMATPSQGTGDVKPAEEGTGGEKASLKDKADPNTDADGDGKAGVDD